MSNAGKPEHRWEMYILRSVLEGKEEEKCSKTFFKTKKTHKTM